MPSKCCAVGCSKRGDRDSGVHFFRFPALLGKPKELADLSKRRRDAWLRAIKRTDLANTALKYTRICSEHFVTGAPARLRDTLDVDWIPSVKMGSKPFNKRFRIDKNNDWPATNEASKSNSHDDVQNLSELEQLKLEIKSKDELINNYKVEKVQRERDQIQVVNNYEQRLKEKDVKIENSIRRLRKKSTSNGRPKSEQRKGRGVTMRVGRKVRKTVVEQKKTKPCFVRLEKVHRERSESKERTPPNRKLTGPLKKRPLNTPSQIVKKGQPPTTVASTRTRRAPKPNPKYANADIITPKIKSKRSKGFLELDDASNGESDSADDYYNALDDETSNESGTNDGDAGDAFEVDESSDFSENEELHPKAKRTMKNVTPAVDNNPPVAKRGRPKKKISPTPPLRPAEQKKSNHSQITPQRTTTMGLQQNRKRKLDEADEEEPIIESIIARNKRLNIALYDANVAKPLVPHKSTSKAVSTVGNTRTQSPASLLAQKKIMHPIRTAASMAKESQKEKSKSPLHRRLPGNSSKSADVTDSASTQDDFETMPTFTIVNIHDIINKKGDCLVQKNPEEVKGTISPNTTNRVNRRKSGHTTILSEKLDPGKLRTPLPRTPFPPRKPISTILNSNTTPRSEPRLQTRVSHPLPERKAVPAEKPAPRILNSVVAKRTYPVQPILGKLDNDIELDATEDAMEKTQMVKENVGANKVLPLKPSQPRKLPPEKVFVQRQGNKLIKKITCFETWYVINIPETQEPIVKNYLDIPLITLSNAAKTIRLPSPSWSTKVTLYKLSTQMIGKTSLTPYTGDLSDQSIAEEDREKYQPSCVMFRRMTQQKSRTRMPYDRAVIFKMKTFFTNIDGKNVRLIGAPSTITSFEEIEVLLELVDELDLLHEFVEPANTV